MFFVTFISSIIYLLQERQLKSRKPSQLLFRLPSLGTLDKLFSKFLNSGFLLMTFGLLAGVIWAERDWVNGWYGDPKVVAALITWTIYLILVYLRVAAGWRGRRAAYISILGFVSMLFTFLGVSNFGGQHIF
jgi:ABC-type transport system involved in cytochrome c biogenesis permease subunit